jgi:UDP-3-O-[3-hydroxymyristoyl] glucosamine N-acyltransferase
MKLKELADSLGLPFEGDPETEILSCSSLKTAAKGSLVYLENEKMLPAAQKSGASAVIALPKIQTNLPSIKADRPALAFAMAVAVLHPSAKPNGRRHPSSAVDANAKIGEWCDIGPCASVGAGTIIGKNVVIHAGVAVGENVTIGDDCLIHPNVVICSGTKIGDRSVIQAGCVIGGDGFRFVPDKTGRQVKFPHIGVVRIGNDVEIGANSCVDRAVLDETVIGDGVKMDNLVQIGHNCEIGENTVIAGCTGISGSVKVGKNVIIGGQVGIKDHVTIADGVMIAAKSGVISDLEKPGIYCGMPAVPFSDWKKQAAAISRGPETLKRVSKLEKS